MIDSFTMRFEHTHSEAADAHWGSLMHGQLMRALPENFAGELHKRELPAFSQHVVPVGENELVWHISSFDGELSRFIEESYSNSEGKRITLTQKNAALTLKELRHDAVAESELFSKHFLSEAPPRRFELTYLTPSTHKSDGSYVQFPSVVFIVNSVFRRMAASVSSFSMDDASTMKALADNIAIRKYKLRSASYCAEGVWIPGYVGSLTLTVRGPEQLARIASMLFDYANYCGVGIKTALGMGAVHTAASVSPSELIVEKS